MPDKIVGNLDEINKEGERRIRLCWNILRTMSDEQLALMERHVDEILEKSKDAKIQLFGFRVGVSTGPELPFQE